VVMLVGLCCQSLTSFFVCSISSGIVTQSKCNSPISSGDTEKVAMEPTWSFGLMPLPFVALSSGASLL
jgi:hypothetical protein